MSEIDFSSRSCISTEKKLPDGSFEEVGYKD